MKTEFDTFHTGRLIGIDLERFADHSPGQAFGPLKGKIAYMTGDARDKDFVVTTSSFPKSGTS
jgi:hypothetical protein